MPAGLEVIVPPPAKDFVRVNICWIEAQVPPVIIPLEIVILLTPLEQLKFIPETGVFHVAVPRLSTAVNIFPVAGVPVEMMMALPREVQICLPFSFMTGCLQFSFVTRSPALFIKGA